MRNRCGILSAFFLLATIGAASQSGPRPIGAGGFPVSFTHASAWFAHRADTSEKTITLLFYFQGSAGWHNQPTSFKWEINQTPARIEMSVGKTEIRIQYWSDTGELEIQGTKSNLASSNVYVIENIDSPNSAVKPLGIHNLSFAPNENPAVVLLRRNAEVWATLTGRPLQEHYKSRRASARQDLVAWDEEGIQLLEAKDAESDRRACELFRKAALQGYAGSQYRLGYCYEVGRGVDQSFSVANEWYEKAATQGHMDAQYKLGHSYRVGRGVPIDLAAALHWYKKAAENGDSEAKANLGVMYAAGQGAEANPEQAYHWFLDAAKYGDIGAQFEIARRLREGDGVARDFVGALAWLLVLRAQERDFAPDDWAQVKAALESTEGDLDSTSRSRAEEQAHQWLAAIAKHEMERFARQ